MISVIVPIYNGGKWLLPALESLKGQSFTDFEVVMVDDGSTDESAKTCMEFAESDRRFRLISQTNAGVSAARNLGIEIAKGEWIAFMDADDVLPPDALELLFSHAMESGAGIVAGKYLREIPEKSPKGRGNSMTIPSDTAILIGLYQKIILNNPWGMLFHSSIFKGEKQLRFRECRYEDLDLFLSLIHS